MPRQPRPRCTAQGERGDAKDGELSHAVPVEEGLYELLALSARLSAQTEGAFDITAGALIKAWGFYRRRGRVPAGDERTDVLTRCGMRHVEMDAGRRTVRFTRPDMPSVYRIVRLIAELSRVPI